MGRWRPPTASSSALITAEGRRRLGEELDELWSRRRPEVVSALAAAAAEGDRSENAEYTYRKKQLGEIDRRVRYLRRRLDTLKVVDTAPADPSRIYFAAWFTIEDETGGSRCYRIVGPDETDAGNGWISIDSPLARAVIGRRVNDEIEVERPKGRDRVVIIGIDYTDPSDHCAKP